MTSGFSSSIIHIFIPKLGGCIKNMFFDNLWSCFNICVHTYIFSGISVWLVSLFWYLFRLTDLKLFLNFMIHICDPGPQNQS